jgi:glycosidase
MGVNALYLGPLFESRTHGYDTVNYFQIDRRLGDNDTLKRVADALHAKGIRVVLDAVLNHTGRDFWAFRQLRENPYHSPYRDWYSGVSFDRRSPCDDPFTYDTWNGQFELPKLNMHNPAVKEHLSHAVEYWIRTFDIDGLRLDAADCLDQGFLRELSRFCKGLKHDFWLMGEVIHGDYRKWIGGDILDSVTNYECYKGLFSSHNDRNFHEIGYALNRQFGEHGIYRGMPLYNFADNHDVNRVASTLRSSSHLFSLYALLFTMPGVPSLYYGSEWGIAGRKSNNSDADLRPRLDISAVSAAGNKDLVRAVTAFSRLRHKLSALRLGSYQQLLLVHEQIVFLRETENERIVVAINASDKPVPALFEVPGKRSGVLVNMLNEGERFTIENGRAHVTSLHPCWARVMKVL